MYRRSSQGSHRLHHAIRSANLTSGVPLITVVLSLLLPALMLAAGDTLDVGLTENGTVIEAAVAPARSTALPTVLLIGGLAGADESSGVVRKEL